MGWSKDPGPSYAGKFLAFFVIDICHNYIGEA